LAPPFPKVDLPFTKKIFSKKKGLAPPFPKVDKGGFTIYKPICFKKEGFGSTFSKGGFTIYKAIPFTNQFVSKTDGFGSTFSKGG
jgi:hypothetical protein